MPSKGVQFLPHKICHDMNPSEHAWFDARNVAYAALPLIRNPHDSLPPGLMSFWMLVTPSKGDVMKPILGKKVLIIIVMRLVLREEQGGCGLGLVVPHENKSKQFLNFLIY